MLRLSEIHGGKEFVVEVSATGYGSDGDPVLLRVYNEADDADAIVTLDQNEALQVIKKLSDILIRL